MRKKWIRGAIVSGIILVLVAVAGAMYLNWMMKQPLYHFGDVAAEKNLRGPLKPPKQSLESEWAVESDINLHFDAYGDGISALVIHGGPGIPYSSDWKGLRALFDRYKFYYYHQRGCGNSTHPFDKFDGNFYENMITLEQTLGLGAQIADIERVRQILGQEKITLIGHSFGGFIAALYAAEFPDRVEKLVLVAPAGVLTPPDKNRDLFELARTELNDDDRANFDELVNHYLDFGNIFSKSEAELSDLHLQVGTYLLKAMGYDEIEMEESPAVGGWTVFAMYFSIGRAQDYRSGLLKITAPTIILVGANDKLALAGSRTYQSIPNSQLILVEQHDPKIPSGHFVYDDSPILFGKTVEEFLID